jgi:hypothetical protein
MIKRVSQSVIMMKLAHFLLGRLAGKIEARESLLRLWSQIFYEPDVGLHYHVDSRVKQELLEQFREINLRIPSATQYLYHVVLAKEILSIPKEVQGCIVECGSYKGASTASLSLVCSRVGRKLFVCDSFEGLPEEHTLTVHEYPHLGVFGYYQKGMYAARLEEVKENISRYGDLSVCTFVPGLFSESLKTLSEPVAFAFFDVDLADSMKDCIRYIWLLLVDGGLIYTDDSCDMEVVRIWFDDVWWKQELGCRAPGYVGSGCGLPLSPDFSSLGYARKLADPTKSYKRVSWLYYPDSHSKNHGSHH